MRTAVSYVLVAAAGLIAWSCGQTGAKNELNSRPKITERRTQTFDFGTARQGVTIEHTFQLTNPGTAPVKVGRVQTTCGCTAAKVEKNTVIEPGKSLELPVKLNLRGKKGAIESKVIVNYADGATPDELVLKGAAAEEYTPSVDFTPFKRGEQPEQIVTLATYPGQQPLAVSHIKFDTQKFDITSRPGAKDGTVDVVIKPRPDAPFGSVADQIVVTTNDADAPDKFILVRAHVTKPLEAVVRQVVLRPGADGEPVSTIVEFKSTYGDPVSEVTASITREKRFTATIEPDAPDGTVRVRVAFRPGDKAKKSKIPAQLRVRASVGGVEVEEHVGVLYTTEPDTPAAKQQVEAGDADAHETDRF
ncbi:MAG: DUF1573 domain-containing protein [Candidatus Hydrogenedentes bacterium]|nr:DUF1573 domain-containing protein [Candidatus Hydrogenedentota bacterium]